MSENLIDKALAEISETEQYSEIKQLENTDLLEISQNELPDRAKDKKLKRLIPIRIMDIFFSYDNKILPLERNAIFTYNLSFYASFVIACFKIKY